MTPRPDPSLSGRPLLEVDDLSVSFGREGGSPAPAVRNVGFRLHAGQTLALVGESGSGKSVTALSILRLLASPPARYVGGRVLLDLNDGRGATDLMGAEERELQRVRGGQIAMIFQEPMTSLNPVMTVGEQIVEAVRHHQPLSATQARAAGAAAMAEVGIPAAESRMRSYPHEFSGGMRQRVMIAMALACKPRLLIADEPTTALDVTVQARILELLGKLKTDRGMAVLLITHDLGLVADHADAVCVMYGGRVVELGATAEVLGSPVHPYTAALLACRPSLQHSLAHAGGRPPRLRTVAEFLDDPRTCEHATPEGPVQWWWPHHVSPVKGPDGGDASPVLMFAGERRWVCAWPGAAAMGRRALSPPGIAPSAVGADSPVGSGLRA